MNMKTFKKIIIWLLVLIGILILVAYLLPGKYNVERSTLIKGDRGMVFSMVCDFNNWKLWSPWSTDEDSTVVIKNIGCCEVGAVQQWDGEEMGKGEIRITELIPGEKIAWEIGFEGYSQMMLIGMTFEAEGDEWLVTWTAEGDLGYNPLYRYYGLMIDSDLGMEYENGLESLKILCEKLPDYPGIEVTNVSSMPALSVKDSIEVTNIGLFLEKYYPILYTYALRNETSPTGHPYAIYHEPWDSIGMNFVEAGISTIDHISGENEIQSVMSPGGKVVKAIYFGPYEKIYPVYRAIKQYMKVLDLESAGNPWEVYVTDPMQEPDPTKRETIVYFPIK